MALITIDSSSTSFDLAGVYRFSRKQHFEYLRLSQAVPADMHPCSLALWEAYCFLLQENYMMVSVPSQFLYFIKWKHC